MIEKIKKNYENRKNNKKYFKWLIKISKSYKKEIFIIIFLNTIITLIGVFSSVANKYVVDMASSFSSNMYISIAIVIILSLMSLGLSAFSSIFNTYFIEKFSFGFRKNIYEEFMNSRWNLIKKYHSGDILTRLTTDINNVSDGMFSIASFVISLIVQLVSAFLLLLHYDASLAIFAIILGPFTAFISVLFGVKLKKIQEMVQKSESKYRSFLQENISNISVIKAFSYEKESQKKLDKLRDERLYWVMKKSKISTFANFFMGFAFSFGYLFAFILGAVKLSQNNITYGTMTAFLSLVSQVQRPIVSLANIIPKIISILASSGRIIEINILEKEESSMNLNLKGVVGLKIKDLDFSYKNKDIMRNFNLIIEPGEIVAIMGHSGVGKTTLINLILYFLKQNKGTIEFFDKYGNKESISSNTRKIISYIPQGNTLFSGSISNNLRVGKEEASVEEMEEALKNSCALEFVNSLKDGLNTIIGEHGYGLSEGQAQRIAIARALIKKSQFMILDEATSSLDMDTELNIIKNIMNIKDRPTCLIVTHRKSILKYCNRIITIK
ncbi:MAG: ABC transporter ATP-binding protein/permease [Clostridium sp.]|nr:ABC transporter ATP-binding protein/permease [Clostridium sp.]MCI7444160.1 ABC transporter ATP-binding protein/permease [Clostridium sp.]